NQLGQRSINRGPADAKALLAHLFAERIGIEVIVLAEDVAHHVALLVRVALSARTTGQVLAEFLFRALRYGDGWQFHATAPSIATSPSSAREFGVINNDSPFVF